MTQNAEKLAERAGWLREQLDNLPPLTDATAGAGSDWIAMRTRRVRALEGLLDRLLRYPDRPFVAVAPAAKVRMLGITSTSTMGIEGALRNWIARAEALSCTPRR